MVDKHHILLDGKGYIIQDNTYTRQDATPQAARVVAGAASYDDLSEWSHWAQDDWVGGQDMPRFDDPEMYLKGENVNTFERFRIRVSNELKKTFDYVTDYGAFEPVLQRANGQTFLSSKQHGIVWWRLADGTWGIAGVIDYGIVRRNVAGFPDAEQPTEFGEVTASGTANQYNVAPVTAQQADGTMYVSPNGNIITVPDTNTYQIYIENGVVTYSSSLPADAIPLAEVSGGSTVTDTRKYVRPIVAMTSENGELWLSNWDRIVRVEIGTTDPATGAQLNRYTITSQTTYDIPDQAKQKAACGLIQGFYGYIVANIGQEIWAFYIDSESWDVEPRFRHSCQGVSAMEIHASRLYFGGFSYLGGSVLYQTNLTGFTEVYRFPSNFRLYSLCSYWGWLYVGGGRYTEDGSRGTGVLYGMRGTAIQPVKEFPPDPEMVDADNQLWTIYDMHVFEEKLWVSANNFTGFEVYDAYHDAWHVACVDNTLAPDRYNLVRAIDYDNGMIICAIQSSGVYIRTGGDYTTFPDSGSFLVSSDYDAGLAALDKYWADVTLTHSVLKAGESVEVKVRYDDEAWQSLGMLSDSLDGETTFTLDNRSKRIALRLDFSTPGTSTPEVYSWDTRHVPLPARKYAWGFVIPCIDNLILLDETKEARSGQELLADLASTRRERVAFTDVDGQQYNVIVQRTAEQRTKINKEDGLESYMQVSLLEV